MSPPIPSSQIIKEKPQAIKEKLFNNYAESLFRILLWFPLFGACWLVNGIIIVNINLFSLIFAPLMGLFLYIENSIKSEKPEFNTMRIFLAVIFFLLSLFIYDYDKRTITGLSFALVAFVMIFSWPFRYKENLNILATIVNSIYPLFILSGLLFLGLYSQINIDFEFKDLQYLFLVLIPGTVLVSRQLLLYSEPLKNRNWKFQIEKKLSSGEISQRPGGLGRIVIGMMILGPAIPALILPFDILPRIFFLVSLSFLLLPNLAISIQNETGTLENRVINLTKFAGVVMILTFLSAFLHKLIFS